MALDEKEKQARFRDSSRKNGDRRLQTMLSPDHWKILESMQKELGWSKKQTIEAAIAQMAGRLFAVSGN